MKFKAIGFSAFLIATSAHAQAIDAQMSKLAAELSSSLKSEGIKNVAMIEFKDLQGRPTELGRFLADQLTVRIVSTGGVSMVDRTNIKSILDEHKLTEDGLVKPENAKKLGEFAGVDAILNGVVTQFDDRVVLTVRATATSSARIVAAGMTSFPKSAETQQLLSRSVTSPTNVISGGIAYEEQSVITTKELGKLHVALKSISAIQVKDVSGVTIDALRIMLEIANRDSQIPIRVGANARSPEPRRDAVGSLLRTTLVDDLGNSWVLPTQNVTGAGVVGSGWAGSNWETMFEPSDIARLLERQDKKGGNEETDNRFIGVGNTYHFVYGTLTPISVGDAANVMMTFVRQDKSMSATAPKSVQMNIELVVGTPSSNGKMSYAIQSVAFDRVRLRP